MEPTKTTTPYSIQHKLLKIPMGETITAFKGKLTISGNFSANIEKHIIIALDNSGSMGGSAMNFSKEGVKELLRYLHQTGNKRVSLISYNTTAQIEFLPQVGAEERINIVDNIKATGRTNFCQVFSQIQNAMEIIPSKEICIIFFTDGQDTCNDPKDVNESLRDFAKHVKNHSIFSETHTIGFTESHDAALLSQITTIGKNQGTFQYCKSSKDIPLCVDSVAGLIGGHTITAQVKLPEKSTPLLLELEESTQESEARDLDTVFYIENQELKQGYFELVVNIETHSIVQKIDIATIPIDEDGKSKILVLQLGLVKAEVSKLIREATNMKFDQNISSTQINSLLERLEREEQSLDKFTSDLTKGLKTSQRKDIFPLMQEVRELIIDFYATLRSFQRGQITNDTIANLNALAYKGITKKGLQKKLDKRTQQNVNLMNDVYQKVNELASKIDFDSVREKYVDLATKMGDCVLSCNSFIDALADEDCLCLTFDIGRSQAAIADPTQVVIKNVFPSFLTAGSFLYSAQFAIKKNEKAHGGFEKYAEGLILKGAAQENITGVMPLYICPENWGVAKLLMKPTLGWSVTLDPLGYAYSQMKIVPFMIMNKLVEMVHANPGSEFLNFQLQLVKETCIQIMKDGSQSHFETRFSEEIRSIFENYVKDPAVRTTDIITSNRVFLCQVYCAIEAGLIEKKDEGYMEEFFKRVLEEELRRRQLNWNSSSEIGDASAEPGEVVDDIPSLLFKILNIDTVKYIEKPLEEFFQKKKEVSANSFQESFGYEKKFLQAYAALKIEGGEKIEEVKIPDVQKKEEEESKKSDFNANPHLKEMEVVTKFEYSLKKNDCYNNYQQKALIEYQETLKRVVRYLYPLRLMLGLKDINADKFKSWGIDHDTKFFCLYLQNKLQGKNWARREAITSYKYKDPWIKYEEFLQFWYSKLIEDEKAKRINQFLQEADGSKSEANANVFLNSQNLNEAAGAFMGTMIGKDINHFYKKFGKIGKNKDPLAKEKIEMMITGHYKGVKLYRDEESWHPSRAHGNMIWRANKHCMTSEEWKALIPSLSYRFVKGEAKCPPPNQRVKKNKLKKK